MHGFYSVDITIGEEGLPYLIEINGSNSGFDGFFIAYGDTSILDAIISGFEELAGHRDVFVVTRLVNFGELPPDYLEKLPQDLLYFRSVKNVHATLSGGITGRTWARTRTDMPPSGREAPTSLDALVQRCSRFKKVMLNVADPSYVIPDQYFREWPEAGVISFKEDVAGVVEAIPLRDQDVLWIRCPTVAFSAPITKGIQMNPEFPYDALADNKLFTYEVLSPVFPNNVPVSIPIGNRCSGSKAIGDGLDCSSGDLFVRKPVLGSQARGIEILRTQDMRDYMSRIAQLEQAEHQGLEELPLELRGVPELVAAWALSFDVSLASEIRLSKPVYCRRTGRYHHGCMRSLALVKEDDNGTVSVRFLGAYWRLAPIPIDGDGLLWERYVASQSQGSFCEAVSSDDIAVAQRFSTDVLTAYCQRLAAMPTNRKDYQRWEEEYWLARYREQVPFLRYEKAWNKFLARLGTAKREALQLKQQAELSGFRRVPSVLFGREELARSNLPFLIQEPHRIVVT